MAETKRAQMQRQAGQQAPDRQRTDDLPICAARRALIADRGAQLGIDRFQQLPLRHDALADMGHHVIDRPHLEAWQGALDGLVGEWKARILERPLRDVAAKADELFARAGTGMAADRSPRLAGDDKGFPGR